jgi:penicillin-binding protein 1A
MKRLFRIFMLLCSIALFIGVIGAAGAAFILWSYGQGLPDYKQLADYDPPTVTRVHAGDGRLIKEFATERRVFVPVRVMPQHVIDAFIAAEDQNFYSHPGVDFSALARAVVQNIQYYIQKRRLVGASTITQQVAKNFLLTNEVSIERKIKEAILAFRIEKAYDKERILELYLNEIYLGYGSYGVAAAALNYFNKSLDELSIAEAAYLAALPKAPNNYHPVRRTKAAVDRRNWVIGRMLEEGFVDKTTAKTAQDSPLTVVPREAIQIVKAEYFLEEVRRELTRRFGDDALYKGGLSVRTTLDPVMQKHAEEALFKGLVGYDRRHGYRGPVTQVPVPRNWQEILERVERPIGAGDWPMALVLSLDNTSATVGFVSGATGTIPLNEMRWARKPEKDDDEFPKLGPYISKPSDVLQIGDVVFVEHVTVNRYAKKKENNTYPPNTYTLRQVPAVNGAIIAIDPHTGRVYAMSGGYEYELSEFNRATQAQRQPGSAFKPFVYLTALEKGFTPSTYILDAPFVIDQGPTQGKWKPHNYSNKFFGPSPMRLGIEKSRNLMTVRLAQKIGMEAVAETAKKFGIAENLPPHLAMALGASETTLFKLTAAYAMLVNGGKRVVPSLIDRVQDRNGKTVFRHDTRECDACRVASWEGQEPPEIPDTREQLVEPASAYQIVSMLEGVVKRGTGRRIGLAIKKPLAGKTGTSNNARELWFIGFSPDLVVGVYVGFDDRAKMGKQETGSSAAAPIFQDFMEIYLKDKPAVPFRIPPGIRLVRVNPRTGKLITAGETNFILEAYKEGSVPDANTRYELIDGSQGAEASDNNKALPATSVIESPSGLY